MLSDSFERYETKTIEVLLYSRFDKRTVIMDRLTQRTSRRIERSERTIEKFLIITFKIINNKIKESYFNDFYIILLFKLFI